MVTALDGKTLPEVVVRATGPVEREGLTDPSGLATLANVMPGTYRLRFEHERFVTFEKEVVIAAGKPLRASASLTAAPPPPEPPKPEAPPPPPPVKADGSYSPNTLSLPDFIESNYIGGAQMKRSPIGCTASSSSTLLQIKEPVGEHVHGDADETLYVVAGEGVLRMNGRDTPLAAASFAVIPRGVPHTLTRRGSRPLIFVSTLTGPPCQSGQK
jgi:mannose-6-phosphate isomerase-like protein (cupin superfamily)